MNKTTCSQSSIAPHRSMVLSNVRSTKARRAVWLAAVLAVGGLSQVAGAGGGAKIKVQQVVSGSVTITPSAGQTRIAASNGAIVNFSQFDIPKGTSVNIVLPTSGSRLLDRVTSGLPSVINGSLFSNGTVYFVNASGIVFGSSATVNAGRFFGVAGTLGNADFVAGQNHFTALGGSIQNAGTIHAQDVALVGATIVNTGSIVSDRGTVAVVTGHDVMLTEKNSHVFAKITPSSSKRFGGGDVFAVSLQSTGRISGRNITVQADPTSAVAISGSVDASNASKGGTGGIIDVTGGSVALTHATVDASGGAGGGTVNVGGDKHGAGPLTNASTTSIDSASAIHVDATANGTGGNAVVWSNAVTNFSGLLTARGAGTGNGGNAEISSHGQLNYLGGVDLKAPKGIAGTLLLDPDDIIIGATTSDPGFNGTIASTDAATDSNGTSSTISVAQILGLQGSSSKIMLSANKTITLDASSPINFSQSTALTLSAPSITLNSDITGKVDLTLTSLFPVTFINQVPSIAIMVNGNLGTSSSPLQSIYFHTYGRIAFGAASNIAQSVVAVSSISVDGLQVEQNGDAPKFAPESVVNGVYPLDIYKTNAGSLTFECTPGKLSSTINLGLNRNVGNANGAISLMANQITTGDVSAGGAILISGPATISGTVINRGAIANNLTLLPQTTSSTYPITGLKWPVFPLTSFTSVKVLARGITVLPQDTGAAPQFYTPLGSPVVLSNTTGRYFNGNLVATSSVYALGTEIQGGLGFSASEETPNPTVLSAAPAAASSNPATEIAGNAAPLSAAVTPQETTIDSGDKQALKQLGIYARDNEDETTWVSPNGNRIIDDWPHKVSPSPADRQVSAARVSGKAVHEALNTYHEIFGVSGEKFAAVRATIQQAVNDAGPERSRSADDFANFVQTSPAPAERAALVNLRRLGVLKSEIENMGLSSAEIESSYPTWMSPLLRDTGHTYPWLKRVIDDVSKK